MLLLLLNKTKELGCGAQKNDDNEYFIICIYNPSLNYNDDYQKILPELKTTDILNAYYQHNLSRFRTSQMKKMLTKNGLKYLKKNRNE